MSSPFTRVLIMGDTHCGSSSGLTPPSYDAEPGDKESSAFQLYELRRWHWGEFTSALARFSPFDVCLANGDLIDGTQKKSNGFDLIEQDRLKQANMATQIIKTVDAKQHAFTLGTPYHTGDSEDFEQVVAGEFGCQAKKSIVLDVNGVKIQATHHAAGSQNPGTRQNRLGVEAAVIRKRFFEGRAQKIDLFFRSHAHYSGSYRDGGLEGWRVPSLQLVNTSKYGRSFGMDLDYGFLVADIYGPGAFNVQEVTWKPEIPEDDLQIVVEAAHKERRKANTEILSKPVPYHGKVVPRGLY
jgi:hypothetical protein